MVIERRRSRLRQGVQEELIKYFCAGVTARAAADVSGVNRNTAILFYHKLRKVTRPGVVVQLNYDPFDRLFVTTATPGTLTKFLYDGDALIGEYDTNDQLLQRTVHGPGVDAPLVRYDAAGVRRWLHADERGSVVAESDAAGLVVATYSYGPYGEPDSTADGRLRYTGQMLIPELGLYHYRARTYSAYLGRFLQADPAGYADGLNLYAYGANDPINATDPSGLAAVYCQPNFTFQSVFGVDYSGIGTSDGQLKCEYTGGGDTGGDLPRMDNITVRSSKDALPRVAYTSPVFVTDVHNFNINITSGTGGSAATSKAEKEKPRCPVRTPPGSIGRGTAQDFGPRLPPTAGASSIHNGQDFPNPRGAGVYAPLDGRISSIFTHRTGGNTIILQSTGVRFGFAHTVPFGATTVGTTITAGNRIGSTNVSGASTGPHLHFTVTIDGQKIDPMKYLDGACGQ